MHQKRKDNPDAKRPTVKDKQLDAMIAEAWEAGWWCEKGKGGHVKCYPPDRSKTMVAVANTPSDRRTVPNTRSFFRRSGL